MKEKKSELKVIKSSLFSIFSLGFFSGVVDNVLMSYSLFALGVVNIIYIGWMVRRLE